MRKIHSFFLQNRKWLDLVFLCTIMIALLIQYSTFAGMISTRADHRSIISTTDNDSAAAIETALKTNLINDNGYRAYGPIYYRITSVVRHMVGSSAIDTDRTEQQNRERTAHVQLMLISLLAVYIFGYLIAAILTDKLFFQLLGSFVFVAMIFQNDVRTDLIYIAKPDQLSSLLIAFAMFVSFQWYREKSETKLRWMSVAWGFAAATKLNVLLFAPAILIFFLPFSWRRDRQSLITFLKWTFGTYFIAGFPQNFDLKGTFEYLASQQRNISFGNLEFVKIWAELFAAELKYTVPALLIFSLFVPLRAARANLNTKHVVIFASAVALPTVYLFSRKILPPYVWYPFPFLSTWLVFAAVLFAWIWFKTGAETKLRTLKNNIYFPLFGLVLIPFLIKPVPDNWAEKLKPTLRCRAEAREVQKILDQAAAQGQKLLVDPLLPYDSKYHDKEVRMHWDMNRSLLKDVNIVALKSDYYVDYIPTAEGGREFPVGHIKDLEETRNFYRLFHKKQQSLDPFHQTWERFHSDHCFFELWRRK